jgi:hypothetical protein
MVETQVHQAKRQSRQRTASFFCQTMRFPESTLALLSVSGKKGTLKGQSLSDLTQNGIWHSENL